MQSDTTNILGVIEGEGDGQSQSKQLLDVLRSLLELTSKEGVRMHPTSSWVTIIQGVADGKLLDIPIPGSMAWSMLVDKIHYADNALDLVPIGEPARNGDNQAEREDGPGTEDQPERDAAGDAAAGPHDGVAGVLAHGGLALCDRVIGARLHGHGV